MKTSTSIGRQRKSDILWKVIIEEVFEDLLRFIMPDADREYNMSRGFEFLEKELSEIHPEPEKKSDTRYADKLVKLFTWLGEENWILLHMEIQGDTSKRSEFSERMFRYFYRILDKYRKPVSAVAIFTGLDGRKMPGQYVYEYRDTRVLYEYQTLSILDYDEEELTESKNPFAIVVLAARISLLEGKIPEQELLERKLTLAGELFRKGLSIKKIRAIFTFLEGYVLFKDPEMNRIFRREAREIDKNNVMSIDEYIKMVAKEEGVEKGRTEKETSVVMNLLAHTDFSDEKIANLADVSLQFVREARSKGR